MKSEKLYKPGKLIVLTAPSGAGKTTIAQRVMQAIPELQFSVSATTRPPRPHEQHGKDYYFLDKETFMRLVRQGAFLEYEEVYPGVFYGTLRSEVERKMQEAPVLLDLDVKGALHVKQLFNGRALTVFIRPPSLEALKERLERRGTETPESLAKRLERARLEMQFADQFDAVVVNDDLDRAVKETVQIVQSFLQDP